MTGAQARKADSNTGIMILHNLCSYVLIRIMIHMTTCLIYRRISVDKAGDGHGVANQLADLEKRARGAGLDGDATGCRITTSG